LVDNQPKYIRKGMNGLPALLFDGIDDFFSFNGDFLVGSDYTIFVVEARGSSNPNYFIGGTGTTTSSRLHLGFRSGIKITQAHYNVDLDKDVATFTSQIGVIHSFVFSKISGKAIYTNSGTGTFNTSQTSPLISYAGSSISNNRGGYYQGSIAEIIFYSRALTDQERQGVEAYLSKKWGIKIG
jgi:hypothetical protein